MLTSDVLFADADQVICGIDVDVYGLSSVRSIELEKYYMRGGRGPH